MDRARAGRGFKFSRQRDQQPVTEGAQAGNRAGAWAQQPWVLFAGVVLVGIVLRLVHHAYMQANDPFYDVLWPGGDNFLWDRWAMEIAQTFWLDRERVPFWQGPLYPYALGFVYLRFGHDFTAAVMSQHVLGAIAAGLVADIGRRAFSPGVGLLAGLGAAAAPAFLLFEGEILSDSLILFMNVLFLWSLLLAAERDRRRHWAASGLILGLGCLARPNAILMIPLALAWCAWTTRHARLPRLALVATGVALCILPVTAINTFFGGQFALITTNGPMNLYIGNSHDARGDYSRSESYRAIMEASDEHEHEIAWSGHLRASLSEHPMALPRNLLWKARLFWQRTEIPHNVSFVIKRDFSPLLRTPLTWAWLLPLGVTGIVLALAAPASGEERARRLLLVGFLLIYAASIILVFVLGRFRLPALAVVMPFAAYAVLQMTHWLDAWRTGRRRDGYRLAAALSACGLIALSMLPPRSMPPARWNDYYNLGGAHETKGNFEAAAAAYDAALRLEPGAAALEAARDAALERAASARERPTNPWPPRVD